MGGEATQDLLYQQQLAYLSSQFGISIIHPTGPSDTSKRWPTSIKLNPTLPGAFGALSHHSTQQHFLNTPTHAFRVEFQQGYKPPRPTMRLLTQGLPDSVTPALPPWQSILADPTEDFYTFTDTEAFSGRRIISEALSLEEGTTDLTQNIPLLSHEELIWEPVTMMRLDLWGETYHYVEEEVDPEQEAAERRVEKRKRGARSPSPIGTGNRRLPKLVGLASGKNALL